MYVALEKRVFGDALLGGRGKTYEIPMFIIFPNVVWILLWYLGHEQINRYKGSGWEKALYTA